MTAGAWIYLWIGLVLTGLAMGSGWERCPKDDMPAVELVATVIAWPAVVIGVITTKAKFVTPACKVQS